MGLQKKLDKAREEGYNQGFIAAFQRLEEEKQKAWLDGIKVGADASNEVWMSAVRNAKGIGPKLLQSISEQADKEHKQRIEERKRLAAQHGEVIEDDRLGTEREDSSQQADQRGAC